MFNATKSPGESCQTNENIALGRTTILFGGDLDANLPYGSKLRMTATYLPKLADWGNNYVIRGLAD